MSYYVSLAGNDLERVSSVTQNGDRDISVFDGVGSGKFPVPQHRNLKSWSIKFQTYDPDIFDEFDSLLKKEKPARLVINGEDNKTSERVLLKSYTKEESEFAGVYNGTVTVVEYAKAAVKTIAVPYSPRAGSAPAPPKTTITGNNQGDWAYNLMKANDADTLNEDEYSNPDKGKLYLVDDATSKAITNTAMPVAGTTVTPYILVEENGEKGFYDDKGKWHRNNFFADIWDAAKENIPKWHKSLEEQREKAYEEAFGK